jgi:hypothetical protein
VGVARETRSDLWRHARELIEIADREGTPVGARRALVVLAVAGAGPDVQGFEAVAREVLKVFGRLGMDPLPLFDAASALCDEDDSEARRVLVTLPRDAADDFKSELLSRIDRG